MGVWWVMEARSSSGELVRLIDVSRCRISFGEREKKICGGERISEGSGGREERLEDLANLIFQKNSGRLGRRDYVMKVKSSSKLMSQILMMICLNESLKHTQEYMWL